MAAASVSAAPGSGAIPARRPLLPWCIAGFAGAGLFGLFAAVAAVRPSEAAMLRVRVTDALTGAPIGGAFVQVGPAPGDPFPANWGATDPTGVITFSDDQLTDPQTVTVAASDFARQSVIGSAVDSIAFWLQPEVTPSSLPEPRAEISGTVSGISTQSNDGRLDVGIVYPAIGLSDILQSRSLPFEVPADTVSFPLIGEVVIPGNVMLPTQTEGLFFTFSKPAYHFFVPDANTYDFLVVAGRLPLTALGGSELPLNVTVMREVGAERAIPVAGDLVLPLNSDLNLQNSLWVQVPEAPDGSEVFTAAVADLPGTDASRSLFFDAKTALADTLSALLLSGFTPAGDLGDAVPYLAGYYADSSAADLFQAGRVDRTPLTLPATRTLGDFFRVPQVSQQGDEWCWTDVTRPGVTPDPTWAISTFRVAAEVPGAAGVTPRSIWEVWAPAGDLSFRLPILAAGAPGGLPDPTQTPEEDQLFWDCWIADPSGSIRDVMQSAFATLTRWSRRTIPVVSPAVVPDLVGFGTLRPALRFVLAPNPGPAPRDVFLESALPVGEILSWSIVSPSGRQLARGSFACAGRGRHADAIQLPMELPTGVFWMRLEGAGRSGSLPLVVIR